MILLNIKMKKFTTEMFHFDTASFAGIFF